MRLLVTGGSGYIGSVVVRRLLERGDHVTVFDNLERGHRGNVPSEAKLVIGDLRTCVRDYVHLEDLCSAHLLALDKGAVGAFNLGTGKGASVLEIVEACRKVTGHPIPVKLSPRRPGDPPSLYASGAKARRELGWNPTHSDVETIVCDAWTFHRAHPKGLEPTGDL